MTEVFECEIKEPVPEKPDVGITIRNKFYQHPSDYNLIFRIQ